MKEKLKVIKGRNPRFVAADTKEMTKVKEESPILNDPQPETNPINDHLLIRRAEVSYKNPRWQSRVSHLWQKMGLLNWLLNWIKRILLCTSVISCLVTVVVTIVAAVKLDTGNRESAGWWQKQQLSQDTCVECSKLVVDPTVSLEADPLLDKLTTRVDNGCQMCCARDAGQMTAMVESIVKKRETRKSPKPQCLDSHLIFTPVFVHKQLIPPEVDSNSSQTGPQDPEVFLHNPVRARFSPDMDDPLTELVRGVRVLNSSIEILHAGLYYVYFSVLIRVRSDKPVSSFLAKSWVHYVLRCRPGERYTKSLFLQTAHTTNADTTRDQESSFAGGAFYLDKGDLIEASVFARGLIDYQRESTYLGLFMLESGQAK